MLSLRLGTLLTPLLGPPGFAYAITPLEYPTLLFSACKTPPVRPMPRQASPHLLPLWFLVPAHSACLSQGLPGFLGQVRVFLVRL